MFTNLTLRCSFLFLIFLVNVQNNFCMFSFLYMYCGCIHTLLSFLFHDFLLSHLTPRPSNSPPFIDGR